MERKTGLRRYEFCSFGFSIPNTQMFLWVLLVLGGILMRMTGKHDHAVRFFAAMLPFDLIQQLIQGSKVSVAPLVRSGSHPRFS